MLVRYLRQFLLLVAVGGFSQTVLAQGSIPNGTAVSGQLSAQAVNQWAFSANSGDYAAVAIAVTGAPAGASACFRIEKPDGSLLPGCYYGNYAAQVSESGTYTLIVVRGDGGQHGGTVSYVLNLAQAPESYEGSEDGGVMANGQEYKASLTPGDLDQWSIFLQANDYLFLALGAVGSGPDGTGSAFTIVSPAGTQIGSGAYSSINFRATVSGEYRVIVYRNDGLTSAAGSTADYRLTAAIAPQPFVPTSGGGNLSSGGLYSGMLSQGDLGQWSFDAVIGQPITVDLAASVGNPTGVGASFSIVQPDGSLLFNGAAQNRSFTASQTGSYRVIVYRNDGLTSAYYQTALYNLTLTGSSSTCGDDRDALITQYKQTSQMGVYPSGVIDSTTGKPFIPKCSDFTKSAHSQYFSFSDLHVNDPNNWALVRYVLVSPIGTARPFGLDAWRASLLIPENINSAYRSPAHNKSVSGSASKSRHMFGDAIDMNNSSQTIQEWKDIYEKAQAAGANWLEGQSSKYPCRCVQTGANAKCACVHADWRRDGGGYQP